MTDTVQVRAWVLLVYTLSTVLTTVAIVYLSIWLRRYRTLSMGLSKHLRDCTGVVAAISSRGNLICDGCHQPIAPMTPTMIEEAEPGRFTISHDLCP